jgi:cellulose biosynthesis protein BcsQ
MIDTELGKIVAFYSFKGGTGRTMALANVGCTLAQNPNLGRPVLLIDWDLEAPGLHLFFRKRVSNAFSGDDSRLNQAPGLIDLFIELRSQIAGDGAPQDSDAARALLNSFPLSDYIIKTDVPRLHLLKAGRFDHGYAANVSSFQWPELYRRSPHLLRRFADQLSRDYSFVIIDSRTGLNDTSGICAMLMPEILVTVFVPNLQNLFGVIDLVREAAHYRAKSDDLRPLIVYPLPSRIEASEPDLRQRWRFGDSIAGVPGFQPEFEAVFKEIYELPDCDLDSYFDDVQIQHVPRYAYGEEIVVLVEETRDRFSLTQSYLRFTFRVMKGDLPGTDPPSDKPYLYIVADDHDISYAQYLKQMAEAERLVGNCEIIAAADKMENFSEAIRIADILVFLYGAGDPVFLDEWLRVYARKKSLGQTKPPELEVLIFAPPPKTTKMLRGPLGSFHSIDSEKDFSKDVIYQILDELRQRRAGQLQR